MHVDVSVGDRYQQSFSRRQHITGLHIESKRVCHCIMPPRKKASPKKDAASAAKPAASKASGSGAGAKKARAASGNEKKKRIGPYKMPPPLPKGEILTDFRKNKWSLGTSVGKGGFGEIYTACPSGKSIDTAQYVIKIVSRLAIKFNIVHHVALMMMSWLPSFSGAT